MTPEIGSLKLNFLDLFQPDAPAEVMTLSGELSNRKYYRILVKKPSQQQKLPSYVLQAAESFDDPQHHPFLIAQQILRAFGIRVPKIFGVAGHEGWIVVEDCGDFFLQYRQELPLYREAIAMILALQKCHGKNDQRLPEQLIYAPHWDWAFDFEKLNAEMRFTETHFFSGLLKQHVPFAELVENNSRYLSNRPRILCHRDFHSRNLLVHEKHVFALDFQDARMGPVSYDLVSLLWDPYANLKPEFIRTLLREWESSSDPELLNGIDEEIERMKIQRLMKAIGSYAAFFLEKKNPSCLVFIELALFHTLKSFEWLDQKSLLTKSEKKISTIIQGIYQKIKKENC